MGFVRWTLRTIDIEAARAFYAEILEEGAPDVVELPPRLLARGAKPHWLGYLATRDLPTTLEAFAARGATRLGDGELLRDPGGAILALTGPREPSRRDVVWHQLFTPDPARASQDYGALFGMRTGARVEVPGHGAFDPFDWGSPEWRGSIGALTSRPGVHPQWLFFFRTAHLDRAVYRVRDQGALVLGPTTLRDGRRVAVCDDPQGAAFGLMES